MNTQDKITEVYQNAFKDFAVEAPASVQAGALSQLGRKSLLTLDPARFNVFYMALISGAIAWAIIGTNSNDLAQENNSSLPLIENAKSEISSISSLDKTANLALQSTKITSSLIEPEKIAVSSEVSSEIPVYKFQKKTNLKSTKNQLNEAETDAFVGSGLEDVATLEAVIPNSDELEFLTPVQAELKESIDDITKLDPISLSGAKVQRPEDLIRQTKLDSDNEIKVTVYTKK